MALKKVATTNWRSRLCRRVIVVLAASFTLSACAQQGGLTDLPDLLASNQSSNANQMNGNTPQSSRSELEKATVYWGKQYGKNPQDLNAALSYARNLKAMNQKRQALAVLQNASRYHGRDPQIASEYGRLALDFDQISVAEKVLAMADNPGNPDWKVISARGTVHAKRGEYDKAIPFYERALALAPGRPSLLNNLAMAYVMQGQPERAEPLLRQASSMQGGSGRVRQNLALALGLQGKYDESKQVASQVTSTTMASQSTNAIRQLVQLKPKSSPAPADTNVALKQSTSGDLNAWQNNTTVSNTSTD